MLAKLYFFLLYDANNRSSSSEKALKQSHNVSSLLDELLVDYDNSLRPDIGGKTRKHCQTGMETDRITMTLQIDSHQAAGPPLVVNIDIVVRSMGTCELDCISFKKRKRTFIIMEMDGDNDVSKSATNRSRLIT